MRDVIVIAGGFNLDGMGASAVRALGMAALFRKLGYEVQVLGKFATPDPKAPERMFHGIPCRDLRQPVPDAAFPHYEWSERSLMAAVDAIGADRVRGVVMYNYPAVGGYKSIRACRARGIAPILDCTEWQLWEGPRVLRNIWRLAQLETRMRLLVRLAGNVICASSWYRRRLPRQHTLLLPFVLDTRRPEWQRTPWDARPDRPTRLLYSGSPGVGMVKDRLPPMIEALSRLAGEGLAFECTIAGMTERDYLNAMPGHAGHIAMLGHRVRFLGRVPHAESLDLLRQTDFSVFFRKPDRVANTGFATKFVEATTLGIPVVSNPTSDLPLYIQDGETGIMAEGIGLDQLATALRRAITLPDDRRARIMANVRARNPFDMDQWAEPAAEFLRDLRGVDG